MIRFMKIKKLSLLFLLFFLAGCGRSADIVQVKVSIPNTESEQSTSTDSQYDEATNGAVEPAEEQKSADDSLSQETTIEIPARVEWPVVFVSQAPQANWDNLHQEACEEASMIMAAGYFAAKPLDTERMEEEIQKLVAWEKENGYSVDLTATEAVTVLKDYFGQTARAEEEVTPDRIKYELSRGNLIIAPAAGRELGNPYFRTPGPIYHMLVVKGYDEDEFITNDVGTKRGDGFRYKYDKLISAIHDWDHQLADGGMTDEEMARGRKALIVVEKP